MKATPPPINGTADTSPCRRATKRLPLRRVELPLKAAASARSPAFGSVYRTMTQSRASEYREYAPRSVMVVLYRRATREEPARMREPSVLYREGAAGRRQKDVSSNKKFHKMHGCRCSSLRFQVACRYRNTRQKEKYRISHAHVHRTCIYREMPRIRSHRLLFVVKALPAYVKIHVRDARSTQKRMLEPDMADIVSTPQIAAEILSGSRPNEAAAAAPRRGRREERSTQATRYAAAASGSAVRAAQICLRRAAASQRLNAVFSSAA